MMEEIVRVLAIREEEIEVDVPEEILGDPEALMEAVQTALEENTIARRRKGRWISVEKANGAPLYEW